MILTPSCSLVKPTQIIIKHGIKRPIKKLDFKARWRSDGSSCTSFDPSWRVKQVEAIFTLLSSSDEFLTKKHSWPLITSWHWVALQRSLKVTDQYLHRECHQWPKKTYSWKNWTFGTQNGLYSFPFHFHGRVPKVTWPLATDFKI